MSQPTNQTDNWDAIRRELEALEGLEITVGVHSEEASTEDGANLALIATVHEFGSSDGRIPKRSFLASTMDTHEARYERLLRSAGELAMSQPGTGNARTRMMQLALAVEGDVQGTIQAGLEPPLAESTIQQRRGDPPYTPLIDNGSLIASIKAKLRRRK